LSFITGELNNNNGTSFKRDEINQAACNSEWFAWNLSKKPMAIKPVNLSRKNRFEISDHGYLISFGYGATG